MAEEPTDGTTDFDDVVADDASDDEVVGEEAEVDAVEAPDEQVDDGDDEDVTAELVEDAAEDSVGEVDPGEAEKSKEPAKPATPVVRRKVVSKRVTPKGGGPAKSSGPATKAKIAAAETKSSGRRKSKKHDDDLDETFGGRYTPPSANAQLPSPWWVPALMFGLLIIGALIIILNYMGVFGDPANIRLLIGLAFILGGIIAATQYR